MVCLHLGLLERFKFFVLKKKNIYTMCFVPMFVIASMSPIYSTEMNASVHAIDQLRVGVNGPLEWFKKWFFYFRLRVVVTGGSKWEGTLGTCPILVQFLSFWCSFRQKSCQRMSFCSKLRGWCPTPPSEKSWIRHWQCLSMIFKSRRRLDMNHVLS